MATQPLGGAIAVFTVVVSRERFGDRPFVDGVRTSFADAVENVVAARDGAIVWRGSKTLTAQFDGVDSVARAAEAALMLTGRLAGLGERAGDVEPAHGGGFVHCTAIDVLLEDDPTESESPADVVAGGRRSRRARRIMLCLPPSFESTTRITSDAHDALANANPRHLLVGRKDIWSLHDFATEGLRFLATGHLLRPG